MQIKQIVWILALATTVSGCSSTYVIRATIIDGAIAFVADTDFFGNPDCFGSIIVATDNGPSAGQGPNDDVSAVRRKVYWQQMFASPSCENSFPVKYGSRLSGPTFIFPDGETGIVRAQPLARGNTYSVFAESSGSAYGGGKFRITEEGRVINLPL